MQHLAVKAAVSEVTDRGEFSAIAAAYTVDRVKDRIVPGAFEKTIAQWQASGKRIPLHWDHRGDAANVIGSIDPAATRELDQGLYVEGKLDLQDSEVAREAWRSMKNDAVSLSFGYVTHKTRRRGGINDLLELDLFEVSIVPHPANPDTRVLSMKAAMAERRAPTDADLRQQATALGIEPPLTRRQLRRRSDEIALEHALGWQPPPEVTPEPAKSIPTAAQQRRQWDRLRLELLKDDLDMEAIEAVRDDPAAPTDAELREQAKALGLPVPRPREGTAARFRSGLDPTGEQLVKDLNAAYDRAEAIHRPRSRARASRSE
jgi:HK97 family phage prohead protease